jgi:hypothetical protein
MTKYLAIGMAVLVALLGVAGFLLKRSYEANGALETKLAGAQAVIDQREADAKANAIAVAQLAQKLNDTETKVITVTEKIYAAPVTRACVDSPSMRAARDGIRELLAKPPTVPAPVRREPPAALPGPGSGGTQPQR